MNGFISQYVKILREITQVEERYSKERTYTLSHTSLFNVIVLMVLRYTLIQLIGDI